MSIVSDEDRMITLAECNCPKTSADSSRTDLRILDHLPLVRAIACRIQSRLPPNVELDDLIQAGNIGLIDAASKFVEGKGVEFKTYANYRVRGAILDSLRNADWAKRDIRQKHNKLKSIVLQFSALDRVPSDEEIAEKMGVNLDRWRKMAVELRMVGLVSASSYPGPDEDEPPQFISTQDVRPDEIVKSRQLNEVLQNAIGSLPERDQKIVLLYYTRQMTLKEISGILKINESRVSQIHARTLRKLSIKLRGAGIFSIQAFV